MYAQPEMSLLFDVGYAVGTFGLSVGIAVGARVGLKVVGACVGLGVGSEVTARETGKVAPISAIAHESLVNIWLGIMKGVVGRSR